MNDQLTAAVHPDDVMGLMGKLAAVKVSFSVRFNPYPEWAQFSVAKKHGPTLCKALDQLSPGEYLHTQ